MSCQFKVGRQGPIIVRAECQPCRWVGPWRSSGRLATLCGDYATHVGLPLAVIREPEAHAGSGVDEFIQALRAARRGEPLAVSQPEGGAE